MIELIAVIALIVYVAGVIGTAFNGWSSWSIGRSIARKYETEEQPAYLGPEFVERQRAKYEQESLEGARLFRQSPLWPLLALGTLVRIINDSRKDTTP